jgi:hypothetical protein
MIQPNKDFISHVQGGKAQEIMPLIIRSGILLEKRVVVLLINEPFNNV